MKIDPRILGLLAGTALGASACGGGVQTLEGTGASTSSSSATGASSSEGGSSTNVAATNGTSTTVTSGSETTNVSVGPIAPEEYPPPCGRG